MGGILYPLLKEYWALSTQSTPHSKNQTKMNIDSNDQCYVAASPVVQKQTFTTETKPQQQTTHYH